MYDLTTQLESMEITDDSAYEELWPECIRLLQSTLVPQKMVGMERPCEEDDFKDYKLTLDANMSRIHTMIQNIVNIQDNVKVDYFSPNFKSIRGLLLLVIGEQHKPAPWNTPSSVALTTEISRSVCELYNCDSMCQVFTNLEDQLILALSSLRPKLLKDTWKTYPAAVTCYEWIISQVEIPTLSYYIDEVLPTALIITDDFVPENQSKGIDFLYIILKHCSMQKVLKTRGYADVIYHALMSIIDSQQKTNVKTLYSCMAILLDTMESESDCGDDFMWTKRDDVMEKLLENMEFESNSTLRHEYMASLPQFLNRYGCAKWFERLTRILSEYCEHHTDLRTLKATLETARIFLSNFRARLPSHSVALYKVFLKLHVDLTETPVFDNEIMQNLEYCICLLYKLTPTIGSEIMKDTRISFIIKNNLPPVCFFDSRYFD